MANGAEPVWRSIIDAAQELDAAAIAVGSRGLGGLRSLALGSVSTAVLHHAHRPVVAMPSAGLGDLRRRVTGSATDDTSG